MENESKILPSNICRTCLCPSNELKPIIAKIEGETRSILDALKFVVNIDIPLRNGFPDNVCSDCESTLYKADAFKHRCQEVEMILSQNVDFSKDNIINNIQRKAPVFTANTSSTQLHESSASLVKNSRKKCKKVPSKAKKSKNCAPNDNNIVFKTEKPETESEFDDYVDILFVCDDEVKSEMLLASSEPTDDKTEIKIPKNSIDSQKNEILKKVKKTKASKKIVTNPDRKFQCETCLRYFLRLSALKQHILSHSAAEKPLICPFCGKSFKYGLRQHIRRHQGEKPHKCDLCEKRFIMPSELRKHRNRIHKKARPFVCSECGEGFSATSNLYSHQRRRHTGERRHGCDLCPKRFFEASEVTKHMLTHTGEKPYPCPHCGRGFARKHHLITHLKQHRDKIAPNTDNSSMISKD